MGAWFVRGSLKGHRPIREFRLVFGGAEPSSAIAWPQLPLSKTCDIMPERATSSEYFVTSREPLAEKKRTTKTKKMEREREREREGREREREGERGRKRDA